MTDQEFEHLCQPEKKKALCPKRLEMHACSLRWLSHVNVINIILSICSISRELISQDCPPTAFNTKEQQYPAQQLCRQQAPKQKHHAFAKGFEHIQGPMAKAGKGLIPVIKQFYFQQQTHFSALCFAMPAMSWLTPRFTWQVGSAVRALEETGPVRTNGLLPSFICFLFLSNCLSNGFSP